MNFYINKIREPFFNKDIKNCKLRTFIAKVSLYYGRIRKAIRSWKEIAWQRVKIANKFDFGSLNKTKRSSEIAR